jgi:hypothetical protein
MSTKWHRRDYQMVADVLKATLNDVPDTPDQDQELSAMHRYVVQVVRDKFTHVFLADNERFDQDKFCQACHNK